MPRKSAISNETWNRQRSRIHRYYIDENKPLKEVINLMLTNHEFSASPQQYRTQLERWNMRKNLSPDTWRQIDRSIQGRNLEENECEVYFQGYPISRKKLKKELARNVTTTSRLEPPASNTIPYFGIRDLKINGPARNITCSTLPFLDFLAKCELALQWYLDSVEKLDAAYLFDSEQFSTDLTRSQSRTTSSPRFAALPLLHSTAETLKYGSPQTLGQAFDFSESGEHELLPTFSIPDFFKVQDYIFRLGIAIKNYFWMVELSKITESPSSTCFTDMVFDSRTVYSTQEFFESLSKESSIDFQFNVMKRFAYLSSYHLPTPILEKFVRWVRKDKLYGMLEHVMNLDTPTVHMFAFNIFKTDFFWTDPRLVTIVLRVSAIAKFLRRQDVLDWLLTKAVRAKNILATQFLLKSNADPNCQIDDQRPLEAALSRQSNSDIVQVLIDAGAKPGVHDIQLAICSEDLKSVEILLKSISFDPNYLVQDTTIYCHHHSRSWKFNRECQENIDGARYCSTSLQIASTIGNTEMIQFLLPHTGNLPIIHPEVCNNYNRDEGFDGSELHSGLLWDPLKLAIMGGHEEVVKALLQHGMSPNMPRLTQRTIKFVNRTKYLLFREKTFDLVDYITDTRVSYATALQLSILINETDPKILLDHGADVNALSPLGTALQVASFMDDSRLIRLFLESGADVNEACPPAGLTALQSAATNDNLELILWFLERGAKVNAAPAVFNGRSALQSACEQGNLKIARVLLQNGADVNCPASPWFGVTALQAAASSGELDIVNLLLIGGACVGAPGASIAGGRTALEAAVASGHLHIVRRLILAGADINDIQSIRTPPNCKIDKSAPNKLGAGAIYCENMLTISKRRRRGLYTPKRAHFNQRKNTIQASATSLQLAFRNQSWDIIDVLLKNGGNVNGPVAAGYHVKLELKDMNIYKCLHAESGFSVLQEAILSRNTDLIDIALDLGANDLSSQLDFAFQNVDVETVSHLVLRMDLSFISTFQLSKIFRQWLRKSMMLFPHEPRLYDDRLDKILGKLCKDFLTAGARPEHIIDHIPYILPPSILSLLPSLGVDPNYILPKYNGMSYLGAVVTWGNYSMAEFLLKAGADPNSGRISPLLLTNDLDIVKLLLRWGAVPDKQSTMPNEDYPDALLQMAAMNNDLQIAVMLIKGGANAALRNKRRPGYTALHYAAREGHLDMCALLIDNDPEVGSLAERCESAAKEADVNYHFVVGNELRKKATKLAKKVVELV